MFLQYPDLLQLLKDAKADSDDEDESSATESYKRKLTIPEIVRVAMSMFLAGTCINY